MSREIIKVGINRNDGTGDDLRNAMIKVNANFEELFSQSAGANNINFQNNEIRIDEGDLDLRLITSGDSGVDVNRSITVNSAETIRPSTFIDSQGDIQLFLDPSTNRIGVNTSNPDVEFDVTGSIHASEDITVDGDAVFGSTASNRLTIIAQLNGSLIPAGSNQNLGSSSNIWGTVHTDLLETNTINTTNFNTTSISATTVNATTLNGQLVTNDNIRINRDSFVNRLNTVELTANRQINLPDRNGTVAVITNNGRLAGPAPNAPSTSVGSVNDRAGDMAFSSTHFYYCTADYDGSTEIWKRIKFGPLTADSEDSSW